VRVAVVLGKYAEREARRSSSHTSRSEHVAVTGKVKFFNETKGFSYADLLSDLAALG